MTETRNLAGTEGFEPSMQF